MWLNLTDGNINCGRKFFDGSGGNNHAVEHYHETKFPLVSLVFVFFPNHAKCVTETGYLADKAGP